MGETMDISGKKWATLIILHFKEETKEGFIDLVQAQELTRQGL